MTRVIVTVGCLCVLAACRGGDRSDATPPDAGAVAVGGGGATLGDPPRVRPERTGPRPGWPTQGPPADACEKDDDCTVVVWDGPQPPDPCCDARVGYLPVARAHLTFIETFRKTHCVGVSCPPSPFPGAEPACCASIARCVGRKCVSACTLVGEPIPKVSVLDPACRGFRQAPRTGKPVVPPF